MKILIALDDPDLAGSDFQRSGNVGYLPRLSGLPAEQVVETLVRHGAAGLITLRRPDDGLIRWWADRVPGVKFLAHASGASSRSQHSDVIEFGRHRLGIEGAAETLRRCEREFTLLRSAATAQPAARTERSRPVVLIGAGIVNLVTALYLAEDGHEITVLDGGPAPGEAAWRRYGCTHAGDDARMFSLTEMDNYGNQDFRRGPLDIFELPIEERGWLAGGGLSRADRAWIEEYRRVPSWLARAYNDDIFAFNAEAYGEWTSLRRRHPRLFDGVVLADGLLRLYSDPAQLAGSAARHRRLDALVRELPPAELAREFPALARPVGDGVLKGGFLVPGFTLNVHKFSQRIIQHLQALGVRFHWDTRVRGVARDNAGLLTGFDCAIPLPGGAHVVASPGVGGRALFDGSPCAGKIHGVLGGWLRISNAGINLRNSLKVARKGHVTEDANVTVAVDADGREILIVGSGYGYVGENTDAVDERQLAVMRRGIIDTIERLFPDRQALENSSFQGDNYEFKYCVRPWTATSLGLYHTETTADGGLFVATGGHNTGGFAQSPTIAKAVLASLRGEPHPMHALYHPERFTAFVDQHRNAPTPPKDVVPAGG
jgi:glycine/D-amino acid oxidase-like deaminating enzyme